MSSLPWHSPHGRRWWFFRGLTAVCGVGFLLDGLWVRNWSDATSWLLVYAVLGGITALGTWSIGRYGDIEVSRREVRVGRDRLSAAEIDPAWLNRLADGDRPALEQAPRLLGGAFEAPVGWQVLPLRLTDGRMVGIASTDPEELLSALLSQQRARR
ncbi:MAG: hypothetical protein QM804_17965 [Propionicimonas sp.]